jgi:hypothetical protein
MKKLSPVLLVAIVLSASTCHKTRSYQCRCIVKLTQMEEYNVIDDESGSSARSKCQAQSNTNPVNAKTCDLVE